MSEDKNRKRRRMRNQQREEKKTLEDNVVLIRTAIEAGFTTRSKIADATGLKLHEVARTFEKDRELWSLYTIRRRTIVDIATDNIEDIITNKNHPQNFQASKWVVTNYKTDLDKGVLESRDDKDIAVEVQGTGKSKAPAVSITFSKGKK